MKNSGNETFDRSDGRSRRSICKEGNLADGAGRPLHPAADSAGARISPAALSGHLWRVERPDAFHTRSTPIGLVRHAQGAGTGPRARVAA